MTSAARVRPNATGSALVEALVALVLIAFAGLVVATAATTGLRATRRAATLAQVTALAGRELASAANVAATVVGGATTRTEPGFVDPVTCRTDVAREDGLVRLTVRVDGGRPVEHVVLATAIVAEP